MSSHRGGREKNEYNVVALFFYILTSCHFSMDLVGLFSL